MTIDKPLHILRRSRMSFVKEYFLIIFLIFTLLALNALNLNPSSLATAAIYLLVALFIVIIEVSRVRTHYAITPSQIVIEYGIIRKTRQSVFLDNVANINISQGYLQRLLHFGDITITPSAGKEDMIMKGVRAPKKISAQIERLVKEYMDKKT